MGKNCNTGISKKYQDELIRADERPGRLLQAICSVKTKGTSEGDRDASGVNPK